ncbi:hypothetical protein GCM10023084_32780 [Streptomyces lacrimifluminis]|uniref:Secreted protein n=1 Tax=Streptomyces lacrimifluminis TaxID=1500077 RepID=A0A917NVG9_9ACTN|nr:hypothetical protein [Streptomyces lacrimifluminis]GGJ32079.1 hypothetical protein GCM10012282_30920 [Streptomyces lacrimifluminis]
MGFIRLTFCAGVAVAAVLIPVPVASAADGGISVTPASPAPGSDVRLVVRGCTGKTGTAKSEAFVADVLLAAQGQDGALVGGSRVRSSLTPGSYDVTVGCGGQEGKVKGVIAVAAEESGRPSPAAPSRSAASPVAPVPAGGGGAAAELAAAEARGTGPGTGQAVVGLVLAGVAAVVVAVRGVRRGRGTD